MDRINYIKILEAELRFCYDLLDEVSWERRLEITALIITIWHELKREKYLNNRKMKLMS